MPHTARELNIEGARNASVTQEEQEEEEDILLFSSDGEQTDLEHCSDDNASSSHRLLGGDEASTLLSTPPRRRGHSFVEMLVFSSAVLAMLIVASIAVGQRQARLQPTQAMGAQQALVDLAANVRGLGKPPTTTPAVASIIGGAQLAKKFKSIGKNVVARLRQAVPFSQPTFPQSNSTGATNPLSWMGKLSPCLTATTTPKLTNKAGPCTTVKPGPLTTVKPGPTVKTTVKPTVKPTTPGIWTLFPTTKMSPTTPATANPCAVAPHVGTVMQITNLVYSTLAAKANGAAMLAMSDAAKKAIAKSASGVSPKNVYVGMDPGPASRRLRSLAAASKAGGSVILSADITPSGGIAAVDIASALQPSVCNNMASALNGVSSLTQLTSGRIGCQLLKIFTTGPPLPASPASNNPIKTTALAATTTVKATTTIPIATTTPPIASTTPQATTTQPVTTTPVATTTTIRSRTTAGKGFQGASFVDAEARQANEKADITQVVDFIFDN